MHSPWDRQSRFPSPSLEPPNAVTFSLGPPRAPQKPTLKPPEPPRTPLRASKDAQGALKSAVSTIKKLWKYVYLTFRAHEKYALLNFRTSFGVPGTHIGPSLRHPGVLTVSKSVPKPSQGTPWESLGLALTPHRSLFLQLTSKQSPKGSQGALQGPKIVELNISCNK